MIKVVFLKAYDFPFGGAPQNRLLGICRGLYEQGDKIEVHQFTPSKLNIHSNHIKHQIYKSVPIFNHAWRWSPAKTRIKLLLGIIEGMITTLGAILKSHSKSKINYIFINSEKAVYVFPFFLLSKLIGAKMGRDLNEYPLFELNPDKYSTIQRKFMRATNYKWFDVLFIITRNLESFYSPLCKRQARFLYLPVTVDFDRFANHQNCNTESQFITYCGDLSQSKDGVLTLIRAFALIKNKYENTQLKLIGYNPDNNYVLLLKSLISELDIEDRVILTGFIFPEKIPAELCKSKLLVLARPNNLQARGGFPTKLGEYLATGIPVVATSVGELPDFLQDEKNAFLAKPDSDSEFAEAMSRALSNPKLSVKVGIEGKKTALCYFSHSEQGKNISSFLK